MSDGAGLGARWKRLRSQLDRQRQQAEKAAQSYQEAWGKTRRDLERAEETAEASAQRWEEALEGMERTWRQGELGQAVIHLGDLIEELGKAPEEIGERIGDVDWNLGDALAARYRDRGRFVEAFTRLLGIFADATAEATLEFGEMGGEVAGALITPLGTIIREIGDALVSRERGDGDRAFEDLEEARDRLSDLLSLGVGGKLREALFEAVLELFEAALDLIELAEGGTCPQLEELRRGLEWLRCLLGVSEEGLGAREAGGGTE